MADTHELEVQAANGEAVARFLNDSTIRSIFVERERLYFEQWKACDDPAERERLWAQARALGDLAIALQAVVDSGTRATHDLQRATRQD